MTSCVVTVSELTVTVQTTRVQFGLELSRVDRCDHDVIESQSNCNHGTLELGVVRPSDGLWRQKVLLGKVRIRLRYSERLAFIVGIRDISVIECPPEIVRALVVEYCHISAASEFAADSKACENEEDDTRFLELRKNQTRVCLP